MKDGKTHESEVMYPKGHAKNPMPEDAIFAKFKSLAGTCLSPERMSQVIDFIDKIETSPDVSALLPLLTGKTAGGPSA